MHRLLPGGDVLPKHLFPVFCFQFPVFAVCRLLFFASHSYHVRFYLPYRWRWGEWRAGKVPVYCCIYAPVCSMRICIFYFDCL